MCVREPIFNFKESKDILNCTLRFLIGGKNSPLSPFTRFGQFSLPCDWSRRLVPKIFSQSNTKLKTIATLSPAFSRASGGFLIFLVVIGSLCHFSLFWLVIVISSDLVAQYLLQLIVFSHLFFSFYFPGRFPFYPREHLINHSPRYNWGDIHYLLRIFFFYLYCCNYVVKSVKF